ncbi:MAG: hypothetical protein IJ729_03745, partial [Alloprevotella sp.]|nr:hypothetical protein [Alloprevotella sp.]
MTISANRGIVVNNGEVTLDNVNLEITTNKEHYNNPIEAIKKVILINTVCDKYEDHYAKYHRAEQYQIWIAKQQ